MAAAAAAAAAAESETPNPNPNPAPATKLTVTPPPSASPQRSPSRSTSSNRTSAAGDLRSAKQTLKEREKQLNRVNQRSSDMNDAAANFATVAQGLLELSAKKK